MKTMTLYEANALVRETIELTLDQQYWVEAELSDCEFPEEDLWYDETEDSEW
jgi:exonuclease VII large subunit